MRVCCKMAWAFGPSVCAWRFQKPHGLWKAQAAHASKLFDVSNRDGGCYTGNMCWKRNQSTFFTKCVAQIDPWLRNLGFTAKKRYQMSPNVGPTWCMSGPKCKQCMTLTAESVSNQMIHLHQLCKYIYLRTDTIWLSTTCTTKYHNDAKTPLFLIAGLGACGSWAGLSLQVTSTMNFIKGGSIEGQLGPESQEIDKNSEISQKKIITYQDHIKYLRT